MSITIATLSEADQIAEIVAISNKDVAEMFDLNKTNNPKHPSFYNRDWVMSDFDRGEEYFLYRESETAVGCVAFEQPNAQIGYLNRLSVLPEYRNKGIGEKLVNHVFTHAKVKGVEEISIGIIAEHEKLRKWYLRLGFVENGIKEFSHLPFDVLFMKYQLS